MEVTLNFSMVTAVPIRLRAVSGLGPEERERGVGELSDFVYNLQKDIILSH